MKLLFRSLWVGVAIAVLMVLTHPAAAENPPGCAPHNSVPAEERIVLGKLPNAPYVVIIPIRGEADVLTQVRQCVPDAFQAESRFGNYIRAGAFAKPSAARSLSRHLYSLGLDARTTYAP
jgi:hypothetical protein